MNSPIRDRKLVQWLLAYLAGGYMLLEATGQLAGMFDWPDTAELVVLVLLVAGVPAVLVIGWFHGEKGRQEVTRTEMALLATIAVVGLSSAFAVSRSGGTAAATAVPGAVELNDNRYAILPFPGSGSMTEELSPELLLYDAFRQWRELEVVHYVGNIYASDEPAGVDRTFGTLQRMAEELGAGRFVTGDVRRVGAAGRLSARLYDTRNISQPLADTAIRWTEPGPPGPEIYERLAEALLFRSAGAEVEPDVSEPGTNSYHARFAFLQGLAALREWDLSGAEEHFATASRHDREYSRAYFWRAQVMNWDDRSGPTVLALAERAALRRSSLTSREELLLDGLLALERGEFPAACDAYRALERRDSREFAALFGLGECRRRDRLVVRDSSSPSGWRFRSSLHRAIESYRRAFELLPAVHRGFATRTFPDVPHLLFAVRNNLRLGQAAPPDTRRFAAYAGLDADTLSFVPYPLLEITRNSETRPVSHFAAVARQRRALNEITTRWLAAFPDSPDALEAFSLTLEMLGDPAALDTLRSARRRSRDPHQDRRLAITEFFMIVKYSAPFDVHELGRAAALADSLLLRPVESGDDVNRLAAMAAMTGRVHLAARLAYESAQPFDFPLELPAAVDALRGALLVYSALGAPPDSISSYETLLRSSIRNLVPPETQAAAMHRMMDRAAVLAFPTWPLEATYELSASPGHQTLRMQGMLLRGELDELRRMLRRAYEPNARQRPADRTADAVFPEAWMATVVGDTALAVSALDTMLNAIRWLDPGTLGDIALAASLIRAMALRAELAQAVGDVETAAGWGAVVATLWRNADPPLAPLTSRMEELSRQPIPVSHPKGG